MAVAKRPGREKPEKIEQRKVKGRSRTRVRTSGRTALLPQPNLHRTGRGKKKTQKQRSQRFALTLSPPLPLPLPRTQSLSLSPSPSLPVCSFFLSFSPARWGALLFRLWIKVPSHLEDGFSCYHLNKIEL